MTTSYDAKDLYAGKWLQADDIPDDDLILTIKDVTDELIGKETKPKLVLEFSETEKRLILNKTNMETLVGKFGTSKPNKWIGKRVQLFSTEVDYAGKQVLAIRIRLKGPAQAPQPQAAAAAAPAAVNPPPPEDDDDYIATLEKQQEIAY